MWSLVIDVVHIFDEYDGVMKKTFTFDELPEEVKEILYTWSEDAPAYEEAQRLVDELNAIGWDADYDLSGELCDFQRLEQDKDQADHNALAALEAN